jgi:hypothetical protein
MVTSKDSNGCRWCRHHKELNDEAMYLIDPCIHHHYQLQLINPFHTHGIAIQLYQRINCHPSMIDSITKKSTQSIYP